MPERSLEIRVNSVADAKSIVYNMGKIVLTMESLNLRSLELLIAEEVKHEVAPILFGAIPKKIFTGYVKARGDNVLFNLPHFPERTKIEVEPTNGNGKSEEKVSTVPVSVNQKRRGMPKGGWPKKQTTSDETVGTVRT